MLPPAQHITSPSLSLDKLDHQVETESTSFLHGYTCMHPSTFLPPGQLELILKDNHGNHSFAYPRLLDAPTPCFHSMFYHCSHAYKLLEDRSMS